MTKNKFAYVPSIKKQQQHEQKLLVSYFSYICLNCSTI